MVMISGKTYNFCNKQINLQSLNSLVQILNRLYFITKLAYCIAIGNWQYITASFRSYQITERRREITLEGAEVI